MLRYRVGAWRGVVSFIRRSSGIVGGVVWACERGVLCGERKRYLYPLPSVSILIKPPTLDTPSACRRHKYFWYAYAQ